MSIRVVYDTMLFLQAASRPDRVHASIQAIRDNRVRLCLSPELLEEVRDVLARPEQQARFPALTTEAVHAFLAEALSAAEMFDEIPSAFHWPEHPDDDHIFNLAIRANAKYLVTWETRILKLAEGTSPAAEMLRGFAPHLEIVSPKILADALRPA